MTDLSRLDLKGLHLLITRPEAQAFTWAEELKAMGATVTCQPFLSILSVTEAESKQAIINALLKLDEYQKAIFVSQNAVSYGVDWIDQYWPQLPSGLRFFAIGASTAALLQQSLDHWGERVTAPLQAMNSEALLALPDLQAVANEKILIFRGVGGRTHLAESLEARGASVEYCELYRRAVPDTIEAQHLHVFKSTSDTPVTIVHSGETLENLCSALTDNELAWIKQQALLVPGQRVASIASTLKFQTIIVAENATHDSMIGALNDWRQQL